MADFDPDSESNYSSNEENCVASVSSADPTTPIESINLPVVFVNTEADALVDSRSVCTIINETLADSSISHDKSSKWIRKAAPKKLKTFSIELIQTLGIL